MLKSQYREKEKLFGIIYNVLLNTLMFINRVKRQITDSIKYSATL